MNDLKTILNILHDKRGFDFSGYRSSMLDRRIQKRIGASKSANLNEYAEYLKQNDNELDSLIDVLTINVSRFFRDTFAYEYFASNVLPKLIEAKKISQDFSLRVWSAGCAAGEEPYSVAILLKEIIEKEDCKFNTTIIATDIDKKIIKKAKEGVYNFDSIQDVKYNLLKKYFIAKGTKFEIKSKIKNMVNFSEFDMINKKLSVPSESIFGNFDIVLCRNLLIYFDSKFQEEIINKLYYSLNKTGILFLGETELPLGNFKTKLIRKNNLCKIYWKI